MPLMVPEKTRFSSGISLFAVYSLSGFSIGVLSTGTLSPVMGDWSILLLPFTITPSADILLLGRTTIVSPICNSSIPTSTVSSSFFNSAVLGARSVNAAMDFFALPIA